MTYEEGKESPCFTLFSTQRTGSRGCCFAFWCGKASALKDVIIIIAVVALIKQTKEMKMKKRRKGDNNSDNDSGYR